MYVYIYDRFYVTCGGQKRERNPSADLTPAAKMETSTTGTRRGVAVIGRIHCSRGLTVVMIVGPQLVQLVQLVE